MLGGHWLFRAQLQVRHGAGSALTFQLERAQELKVTSTTWPLRVVIRTSTGEGRLPSLAPSGITEGVPNPFIGPYIQFEPGATPYFVPGQ